MPFIHEKFSRKNNLKARHTLLHRDDFLKKLPKNSIGIEIGVHMGVNAEHILNIVKPKFLHLVDSYPPEIFSSVAEANKCFNHAIKLADRDNVEFHKMDSLEAVKKFDDGFFDWVYIDSSHDYESVKNDINAWWPKVKKGGIMSGDDYIDKVGGRLYDFGCVQAVNEFIKENNLCLYFTTVSHSRRAPQWGFYKPLLYEK